MLLFLLRPSVRSYANEHNAKPSNVTQCLFFFDVFKVPSLQTLQPLLQTNEMVKGRLHSDVQFPVKNRKQLALVCAAR